MNRNEMTPRERQLDKLKSYGLAVAIGLSLAATFYFNLAK